MQKTNVADNQQGNALSYLIGILFTDGWVDARRKSFNCRSIDSEILDEVERQIRVSELDFNAVRRYEHAQHEDAYGSKDIGLLVVTGGAGAYLESITHAKTVIPAVVYQTVENQKAFVSGLLDGDGWCNIDLSTPGTMRFQVGIAKTSEMMFEIPKILQSLGIKHGKLETRKLKSGKVLKRLRLNPDSFLASGLAFTARRKQRRVDAVRQAKALLQAASGRMDKVAFNDYKRKVLRKVA